jgi:hypothetical protein
VARGRRGPVARRGGRTVARRGRRTLVRSPVARPGGALVGGGGRVLVTVRPLAAVRPGRVRGTGGGPVGDGRTAVVGGGGTGRGAGQQQAGRGHDCRADDGRGRRDGSERPPTARHGGGIRLLVIHEGRKHQIGLSLRYPRHGRCAGPPEWLRPAPAAPPGRTAAPLPASSRQSAVGSGTGTVATGKRGNRSTVVCSPVRPLRTRVTPP